MTTLAFLVLVLILYLYLLGRLFPLPISADEIHFAENNAGFRLALYRYRPPNLTPGREPLILCHGLASNRHFLDYNEHYSLARYLRHMGFDCFVVELRGRGLSLPRHGRRLSWDWCFDDYVRDDLPAIIATVKQLTQSPKVLWLGHSMGGMVMFAYLGTQEQESIRAFVAMGSPGAFSSRYLPAWARGLGRAVLQTFSWTPLRLLARLIAPLAYLLPVEAYGLPKEVVAGYLSHGLANTCNRELLQFLDWIENETFRSDDYSIDYLSRLKDVTTPFLAVLGAKDWIATPRMCRAAFAAFASPDKQLLMLGRKYGQAQEYDHMALVLGLRAPEEVFPQVRDWLRAHASA